MNLDKLIKFIIALLLLIYLFVLIKYLFVSGIL